VCIELFVISKQVITWVVFVEELGDVLSLGNELNRAQHGTLRDTAFNWNRIGLTVGGTGMTETSRALDCRLKTNF